MPLFSQLSGTNLKTPEKKESLQALWRLLRILLDNLDFEDVVYKVVNSILHELGYLNLGYRIIVLSLIDEKAGGLRRIALSQTPEAARATAVSSIPFEKIVIPFSAKENYCIRVLIEGKPLVTNAWPFLLSPPLSPEAALTNQRAAGIKTSMVYPVFAQGRPIGSLIFSMIKDYKDVAEDERDLLSGFTDLVGLAVQNSIIYTSLQKTSQELSTANKRLEELDRLKNDFVSIASHELRTPMTAIRSYAWMALNRSDIPLSAKLKKYISRTLISTERMINLVNDMLNISRIESGKIEVLPVSFDLQKLVGDVIAEVEAKASEKNLHLQVIKSNLPQIFADPDKVHQILLNLIGNAMKFTPAGGAIKISFFSDGEVIKTSVSDSGVGISPDDLSMLFTKFGRLDKAYEATATSGGTGLGLFICKNLVELMSGSIKAYSEGTNKGTTFTFLLPVASRANLEETKKFTKKISGGNAKYLEPVAI